MSRTSAGSCTLMAYSIAQKAKTMDRAGRLVGGCAKALLPANEMVCVSFAGFDEVPEALIQSFVYAVADSSAQNLKKLKLDDIPEEAFETFKRLYRKARNKL